MHSCVCVRAQYEALKRSSKLLGMYVNRVNGAWAEAQRWAAPEVATAAAVTTWAKGEQSANYRADVM